MWIAGRGDEAKWRREIFLSPRDGWHMLVHSPKDRGSSLLRKAAQHPPRRAAPVHDSVTRLNCNPMIAHDGTQAHPRSTGGFQEITIAFCIIPHAQIRRRNGQSVFRWGRK